MDEFPEIPKIPEEVWEYLAWLQRIQNGVTGASLEILEGPPKRTVTTIDQLREKPDETR